ncbi:10401_t:CDS:2 [Cetraspora pellucida]|uniref:10401_t:CDS:1 n=1 Tax=Cetraspora pellucida TaxID=1433469 RepID=A0A9N8ZD14_9GLOM|nr:10401_t:CDS:2 [Cetraspora pellucida]
MSDHIYRETLFPLIFHGSENGDGAMKDREEGADGHSENTYQTGES